MTKMRRLFLIAFLAFQPNARTADLKSIFFPNANQIFNFGPGCRFSATIPRTSNTSARYDSVEPFGSGGLGIDKLPPPQGYWGVDFHCLRYDQDSVNAGWAISDGELVQFNGWVVTYDDTFGDEKFRQRTLSYCVVRLEKSICGESKVGYLESIEKTRKADLTPYVLKILKSMYFLEDIAPADSRGLETKGAEDHQSRIQAPILLHQSFPSTRHP